MFHATNAALFQIGIFPWLAIVATTLFFAPSWPRKVAGHLRSFWQPERGGRERRRRDVSARRGRARGNAAPSSALHGRRYVIVALLGVFLAIQLLVPFRHFLYPGNVSWTEEGDRFAWHMKLRSVSGHATFFATDPASDRTWMVTGDYLTQRQFGKMSPQPDMILQFAHHMAETYRAEGYEDIEIRAVARASLNGREPQLLVDPRVNLAEQPRSLAPSPWILPLREPLPPR